MGACSVCKGKCYTSSFPQYEPDSKCQACDGKGTAEAEAEVRLRNSVKIQRTLLLKVKVLPGSRFEDAAGDLCDFANKLGLTVEAKFNGIRCVVSPGGRAETLVEHFQQATENGGTMALGH